MQLNDILEETDVKKISQKTNISKENITMLMSEDFTALIKAKALGFISILERDYNVDLKVLREKALTYYEKHGSDEDRMVFTVPASEENTENTKGSSHWTLVIVLGLLAYASWYFITKYDGKTFSSFIAYVQDTVENNDKEELSK